MARETNCVKEGQERREKECPVNLAIIVKLTRVTKLELKDFQ